MAKTKANKVKVKRKTQTIANKKSAAGNKDKITMPRNVFNQMIMNDSLLRSDALRRLLDPKKDLNYECGYPTTIQIGEYEDMFNRKGLGARVVKILPEESWAMNPIIQEKEDSSEATFDKEWKTLEKQRKIFHYAQRIDILSGIGRYGVLLLGLNDGKELHEAVEGINETTGEKEGDKKWELMFLKPFDENDATVVSKENDKSSSRFGLPTAYNIKFENTTGDGSSETKVHWTRLIHIADNRETSEVFGIPRMKPVFNRLLDVEKIVCSSGEMFWKGGWQGLGFETREGNDDAVIDEESFKEKMREYAQGLQRFILAQGVTIKTLAPNIADPTGHFRVQLQYIALTLGVPFRIFIGTEEAKLASTQDQKTWNKRVSKRREDYISPLLLRPLIDRLIILGVLPEVADYVIVWPDLDSPSDKEKMEVAELKTKAMASYVTSGVEALMSPSQFFQKILGMSKEEADELEEETIKFIDSTTPRVLPPGQEPEDDEDDNV